MRHSSADKLNCSAVLRHIITVLRHFFTDLRRISAEQINTLLDLLKNSFVHLKTYAYMGDIPSELLKSIVVKIQNTAGMRQITAVKFKIAAYKVQNPAVMRKKFLILLKTAAVLFQGINDRFNLFPYMRGIIADDLNSADVLRTIAAVHHRNDAVDS